MFKLKAQKQGLVWGVLLIFSGLAALVEMYFELNAWMWAAILFVAGLFAFIIFLMDRSDLLLLLPTYVLWAAAGLVAGIEAGLLRGSMVAAYVLAGIALPFIVGFLRKRDNWGLLIPAYVLLVIGVMVMGIETRLLPDPFIPLYVLTAIALPFIVGFWRNRDNWGLLIPAYVLLAVGVMIMLIQVRVLNNLLIPAYVLLAIAVPFFVVYLRDRSVQWPLIPGGILVVIGLSFLIAENAFRYVAPAVLILAGVWVLMGVFRQDKAAPAFEEEEPEPDELEPDELEPDSAADNLPED